MITRSTHTSYSVKRIDIHDQTTSLAGTIVSNYRIGWHVLSAAVVDEEEENQDEESIQSVCQGKLRSIKIGLESSKASDLQRETPILIMHTNLLLYC